MANAASPLWGLAPPENVTQGKPCLNDGSCIAAAALGQSTLRCVWSAAPGKNAILIVLSPEGDNSISQRIDSGLNGDLLTGLDGKNMVRSYLRNQKTGNPPIRNMSSSSS